MFRHTLRHMNKPPLTQWKHYSMKIFLAHNKNDFTMENCLHSREPVLENQCPTAAILPFRTPGHTHHTSAPQRPFKALWECPPFKLLLCCFNSIWFLPWSWNSEFPLTAFYNEKPYFSIFKAAYILGYLHLGVNKCTYLEILFILPHLAIAKLTAQEEWQWDSFFHVFAILYTLFSFFSEISKDIVTVHYYPVS